ncbi:MAG: hypothetical protein EBV06_15590 [Planctomycetia bacterium]|nr:hypothetical protein [Planctomycetia bacterium]
MNPVADNAPLLRTLSPALRGLERGLRNWLSRSHRYPMSTMNRFDLEGLANDLHRQAEALEVEQPLLVVMLMGGTGVGKSTLLNALGGGNIASASFQRPTTRDPVVYYHESIRPDRLAVELKSCRFVAHDRPALAQKILVDTPDVDSNDTTNREKLLKLLPIADIVLYVGSQEKYHDKIVWELFLQQRKRRAFAFVLNKWDRSQHVGAAGLRPDQDLLRDLEAQGFKSPLLFRTCAQVHVDRAAGRPAATLPDGEQFGDLVNWLEAGLSRLEVEAIKARGVSSMLEHLRQALDRAAPPNLSEVAGRVRTAWTRPLCEEATAIAEVLVNTLEPYQREIEHHFALEGRRRFRGLMAGYLHLITQAQFFGSSLQSRIPFFGQSASQPTPIAWNLAMFTNACSDVAASRQLDARGKALMNRLLVDGDGQGFPVPLLAESLEALAKIDWRQRWSRGLMDVLDSVEKQWTRPTGSRKLVQSAVVFLADWIPPATLLAGLFVFLYRYFDPFNRYENVTRSWTDIFLPFIALLVVLIILHMLINLLLPLRWGAIRDEFRKQLDARLRQELEAVYLEAPGDVAAKLAEERLAADKLMGEVRDVYAWLSQREQAVAVNSLYGNQRDG